MIVLLIVVLIIGLLTTLSLPSNPSKNPDKDFPPPETVVQEYYALFIEGDIPGAAEMLWMKKGEKRYMQPLLMERLYTRHAELRMRGDGLKSVRTKTVEQKDESAVIEVEEELNDGQKSTHQKTLRKGEDGWKILL